MGVSKIQYRDIMYRYDQTRMRNQRILDKRMEQITDEIPAIGEIQEQLIHLSIRQAKLELLHPEDAAAENAQYKASMEELIQKKYHLLQEHGYPRDYLSPIYTCPDCKDTGYVDFKPCHCLLQAETRALYNSSNLADILSEENFETFQPEYYDDTQTDSNLSLTPRQNILRIREICLDFIAHFDDAYDNLIFYGAAGVGKSFLTHCIAKELLDSGHTVVYLTSLQLFDILEKNKFGKNEEEPVSNEQISHLLKSDLLIIDDLGTELTNSFTASQLYYFIEERRLQRRAMVISTNLSFQELHDRYGERIFSRFTGHYNFCKIIGEDIRPMKRFHGMKSQ